MTLFLPLVALLALQEPEAIPAVPEVPPPGPTLQRPPEPAGQPAPDASNPPVVIAQARPRLQVALGLGLSVDHAAAHPDGGLPSFFFAAGLGDGLGGLELRSFANGATQQQVIRLDIEVVGVLRPLSLAFRTPESYAARVLRSFGIAVGPGMEIATYNRRTDRRFGLSTGAQIDFPLGAGATSELRLRIGAHRLLAGKINYDQDHQVGDTVIELYGQLAYVF